MKTLDERTYGDSPAAIDLVKIINERGLPYYRVGKILTSFTTTVVNFNHVNTTTAIYLMRLVYNDCLKRCESLPSPLDTYTKNVLNTKHKIWHLKKNTKQPKKNRTS